MGCSQSSITVKQDEEDKQEPTSIKTKIRSLNKTMEIEHHSIVNAITELSDSRIVTGDQDGYITLFSINYEKEQWTKITE